MSVQTNNFNFITVAAVSPRVKIAAPGSNVEFILTELARPELNNAQIIVFPELCISGYTCGDLFFQSSLQENCIDALVNLCKKTKGDRRLIAVGLPVKYNGLLYNCAAVLCDGEIMGIVPKTHIPNYQEFYEKRWFASGAETENKLIQIEDQQIHFGVNLLFNHLGIGIGIEICEDLWVPVPPSSNLCRAGADVILNLSASDDNIGKYRYLQSLIESQSSRCRCVYAYSSAGHGESSTDLVFSGINMIASDGVILASSPRFTQETSCSVATVDIERLRNDRMKYSTFFDKDNVGVLNDFTVIPTVAKPRDNMPDMELFKVDSFPFIPSNEKQRNENCGEIINIQSWGLAQRLKAIGCNSLVVGISGGLDSTLALLIAHHTFSLLDKDPKGIYGVTMPAKATSGRTRSNAHILMQCLGVTDLEIPISSAVAQHFSDIGHDPGVFNAVYENSQARERTQILMDLSNKFNAIVLGTGDMSELALGWCTYNGDHMSMYNVNAGVPKTLVRYLVKWFADNTSSAELKEVLYDIIDTPISPELIPSDSDNEISQKTEELVGPYELHDFFLYHMMRNGFSPSKIMFLACRAFQGKYSPVVIKKWLSTFYRRFFSQQFKRSCMPDGPKIGSVCLSPRGDWRMPSDASAKLWIKEVEDIDVS